MRQTSLRLLTLLPILLLLAACRDGGRSQEVTPSPSPTATAPLPTVTPIPDATAYPILPAPLLYIDRATGQVVQLARDGATRKTVTAAAAPVTEFDAAGRWVTYVADNSLYLLDLVDGTERLLVDSRTLPPPDATGFRPTIRSPRLSPTGDRLAYALDGIRLITLPDGADRLLLADSPVPASGVDFQADASNPLRFFEALEWAPDGRKLMLAFSYYPEGGGLGIFSLADSALRDLRLTAEGVPVTCCDFTWAADGSGGIVSSDIYTYAAPGLARVDAATGALTLLVDGRSDEGRFTLFRSAQPLADGAVLTLRAENVTPAFPSAAYALTRISPGGVATRLRDAFFAIGDDILWAEDGSGVVIAQQRFESGSVAPAAAVWLPIEGTPVELPVNGSRWRWSSAPQPPFALAAADAAELRAAAAAALNVVPGETIGDLAVKRLATTPRPIWAVYTTGFRTYDPPTPHGLALFTRAAEDWELLAARPLEESGAPESSFMQPGPDFVGEAAVAQAFVNQADVWLTVNGGIGAHGGLFQLLRYDGAALEMAAVNGSGTPGGGYVQDLDGDGNQDVVLDVTDAYVLAYATGVRRMDFRVMRWSGDALVPVELTTLTTAADAGLRAWNNQLVAYAQASLWKDALGLIRQGVPTATESAVRWNVALVELIGGAREAVAYTSLYPLLTATFYGDYPAAAFIQFEGVAPEALFDLNGPLFAGTVAEGYEAAVADQVAAFADRALAAKPDEAGAYFLRGWARYLLAPGDEAAIADLIRAAELAPNNVIYPPAAAYVQQLP